MQSILLDNPRDAVLWKKAFDARFGGKGTWEKKEWDALLGHCMVSVSFRSYSASSANIDEAVSDVPAICFTYELLENYPDAKVILTTRDLTSWAESYRATVGQYFQYTKHTYTNPWAWQYWFRPRDDLSEMLACIHKYEPNRWSMPRAEAAYLDQVARVRDSVPKERLLEFDVKQGWEPLCKFLDKPVPKDKPFPKLMDRAMFRMIEDQVKYYDTLGMLINTAKRVGVVAVLGGLVWFARKRGLF
jgi:hypothetical protein